MKKLILSLFALMTMGGSAMAGDKPVIEVADVEALPGETVAFAVNLTDGKTSTYTAMTLNAYFPTTGFTTTGVYTVASEWLGASAVVGSISPSTGLATIPFASSNAIPGSAVENLVTVNFTVDGSVAVGEYDVTLKETMFEYNTSDKDYADDVTFKVKVVATHTVELDEESTVAPTAAEGVNVRVKRTIKAGSWSTICLPFAMSEAQTKSAFGDDVLLKDFTSWSSEEDAGGDIVSLTIGFTPVTEMEANHPYLIRVSSAISEFTVDGVDIAPAATPKKQVGTGKKKGVFYGNYVAETAVPEYNLFVSNNKFYYSNGSTKIKAFRGYFDLYDILTTVEEASARVLMDDETTGIGDISSMTSEGRDNYYNLAGQKVENPKKELYITNNKKVIIK